jgi:hypothetical protein
MPSLPDSTPPSPPSPLDLDSYSEATRRALYDAAVAIHFRDPDEAHDPDDFVPDYSPDDAGLVVFHALGRWWASWLMLEELATLPESRRREVLRIVENREAPYGLAFLES